MNNSFTTVDAYIASYPDNVQIVLKQVRALIIENAPGADETIAYGMPAYKTNGKPLVYFAGFKKHLGLYATPTGHTEFAAQLSAYKQGKGSVQFPFHQPIPYDLIKRIITFRVQENSK